jgi:hypothetical protein
VNALGTNSVKFAGAMTIEFLSGRRRRVLLADGNVFAKPFTAEVATVVADDVSGEETTCNCGGGLFFIICWFFRCLLGFMF